VPNAYQSFLKILSSNKLKPAKPVETFEGFKKGDFALPETLRDEAVENLSSNGGTVDFYKGVPCLEYFEAYKGFSAKTPFQGGETEALRRMEEYMLNKEKVAQFKKPMTNPTTLKPDTTALSPYLKFGSLSSRTFYWRIQDIYTS